MSDFPNGGRTPHIVVCVPTRGQTDGGFTFDLVTMISYMVSGGVDMGLLLNPGTYIDQNRCTLVEAALKNPAVTHILAIDDDMRFPRDAAARLLKRHRAIIGVNYPKRVEPIEPTAVKGNVLVATTPDSSGVEEVDGIGLGLTLIERRVFERIAYPWFESYYEPASKLWVGEDYEFCGRARQAEFLIHIDHDLSKEIRHAGKIEYELAHTPQWNPKPVLVP